MEFRTELILPKAPYGLDYKSNIFLIGSCFSDNLGHYLQKYKFFCVSNPFGTIFNPMSIADTLDRIIECQYVNEKELYQSQGLYVHLDFHSQWNNPSQEACVDSINEKIRLLHNEINKWSHLYITLGTSFVYKTKNGKVVSNCHKLPSDYFSKDILKVPEMVKRWHDVLDKLYSLNPELKVVFTVSPVRHIKDGIVQNTSSKSRLRLLIDYIMEDYPNVEYFPAYEFLMDDLRDYRFYGHDLIHPNDIAVEYIWEKFVAYNFEQETIEIMNEIRNYLNLLNHKPFYINSEGHSILNDRISKTQHHLQNKYPWIKWE